MKRSTSAVLAMGMTLATIVSTRAQILHDAEGYIDSQYRVDWSQAGLLPEDRSGLLPETPTTADHLYVIDPSTENSDQQIAAAFQRARTTGGTWVIYFLGGVHRLSSSIVLRQAYGDHDIIFRGAGAGATILEFDLGRDGVLFDIAGSEGAPSLIACEIQKGDRSFCSNGEFAINDWVRINEEWRYVYEDEHGCVGQVTQIDGTFAYGYTIIDAASQDYVMGYTPMARRVFPITNIGIENLTIRCTQLEKSTDGQWGSGINVKFDHAVNCWVKGVYSENTTRHHVTIDNSSHIEVSGSYLYNADDHGGNSYGYGIVLGGGSTNCLIENNIFERLRHSMGIGTGANCNVVTYNFSTDELAYDFGVSHQAADLCLHGRFSYANLYEENLIEWIEADDTHDAHGPYNVFVRNKTYDYTESEWRNIKLSDAPFTSVLGCEVWDEGQDAIEVEVGMYPIFDGYGIHNGDMQEHEYFRGNPGARAEATNGDVSYYYSTAPDFMQGMPFPSIGPRAPGFPTPSQDIPSHVRFSSGPLTYLSDPFPIPADNNYTVLSSGATLTKIDDDVERTFFESPLLGLAMGIYKCDVWMWEGTITLPTDYCYFVGWPGTIGYSNLNPNYASLYHASSLLEDGSTMRVRTFFYQIQYRVSDGFQVNRWAPWDPTRTTPQVYVYCMRGATASGTLTENEWWCDTHTLTGDVIVPSGVTLTIMPGTEVFIPANRRITVNGTLIARGTPEDPITFDRSGPNSWRGIYFEDPSVDSECILEHCTFNNCTYAVYCNRSSPRVFNCVINSTSICVSGYYSSAIIDGNSLHLGGLYGILCNNGSPQIARNDILTGVGSTGIKLNGCDNQSVIEENSIHGWVVDGIRLYYSSPQVRSNDIDQNGDGIECQNYANPVINFHNDIHQNGYGIRIHSTAMPILRPDYPQCGNWLAQNYPWDIYSQQSAQIDARYNCWGGPPLISGNVPWDPPSSGCDCEPEKVIEAAPLGNGSNASSDSLTDAQIHFGKGYQLEILKEYAGAVEEYELVISKYPEAPEAPMALVRLPRCYRNLNRAESLLPYYQTVSTAHPNLEVGGMALQLEAVHLATDKLYDVALRNYEAIIDRFKDTTLSKDALFAKWEIIFNGKQDESGAKEVFKQFEKLYPDDELVVEMKLAMGLLTLEDLKGSKKLAGRGNQSKNDDQLKGELPKSFVMAQNYPNPFNPVTTIRYELPENARVVIKVFNLRGEEVTTLLNAEQLAGRYTIQWDGTDGRGHTLASGIYLCRVSFQSANVEQAFNKKMVLLR